MSRGLAEPQSASPSSVDALWFDTPAHGRYGSESWDSSSAERMARIRDHPARLLCQVPVARINRVLVTELHPGRAWLSEQAHFHIAADHPEDYELCMAHMEATIAQPQFVGQATAHPQNFELIRRPAGGAGRAVLVALSLTPNLRGRYRVKSSYLISPEKLEARRQGRRLLPV